MRHRRIDSEKILDKVEEDYIEARRIADERAPRINTLVGWMEARRVRNGIGEDFEWTLDLPRHLGA